MTGLFWAVAAAALALDVGSKLWAVHSLGQRVTVLPGVLELRLSRNDGMALGLLSGVFTGYLCYWTGLLFKKLFGSFRRKGARA